MRSATRIVIPLVLAATACGKPAPPIVIDGSSTVYPITVQAIQQYGKRQTGQPFVLNESSTGAGLARFCAGELDIAELSRHIDGSEAQACRPRGVSFVEVPVAYDAISVVVGKANTWAASPSTTSTTTSGQVRSSRRRSTCGGVCILRSRGRSSST